MSSSPATLSTWPTATPASGPVSSTSRYDFDYTVPRARIPTIQSTPQHQSNHQAIGINADSPNTIGLTTKLPSRANKPAKSQQTSSFSASTPGRKLYKSVVNTTAKRGYRADLRAAAVARASAVKLSQQQKKERAASKPRGASAKKAAVQESS
jgi:hypothetical protein